MKVKKIRMAGFKSFADETTIELGDGITCIVGPNGCGKSNILDAVRWVLGEKSARGLRGKNMEDVIFLGSEHRKQAGMAEVELYFDNEDRLLNHDADEVVVGRRLYLNSASEYYLNGRRTTRREIEKAFMDTGIGKSAYSIMEQGRISEILKATPEYRRNLLDEAAGVSRFKAERKETLDRLHDTEQNMLRLSDILKSKQEEIEHLERQARKTRRYISLKEKLDIHDRKLRFLNMNQLNERNQKAEEKLTALIARRDRVMTQVRESEERIQDIEKETHARMEEMHMLDRAFHQDLSSLDSMRESVGRLDADRKDRLEKMKSIEVRLRDEEKQRRDLEKKHQTSLQLELDLKSDLDRLNEKIAKADQGMQELRRQIRATIDREEQNQKEMSEGEGRQAQLLEELKKVTQDLILELERKKRELESREGYRTQLKENIMERLLSGVDRLDEARSSFEEGNAADGRTALDGIDLNAIIEDFQRYESIEQEFRSLLFDKSGLLSRKEALDHEMETIAARRDVLRKEVEGLQSKRKEHLDQLDIEKNRKVELDLQVRDFEVRRESSQEARENLEKQLEQAIGRSTFYSEQIESLRKEHAQLGEEAEALGKRIAEVEVRTRKQSGTIESLKKDIDRLRGEAEKTREKVRLENENAEKVLPEISQQERNTEQIRVALSTLEEELYNDYQMSPGELTEECGSMRLSREKEEQQFRELQAGIKDLGAFNALAIEELERAQESFDELEKQRRDIEDARKNILEILKDIDEKSQRLFQETFGQIQTNFTEIFQSLFGGGSAALSLTEPDDAMNSGVDIMVQPPGKKNSSISLLSGGEQSMTAIALMFAIYLVRPSPFCFLDEIDAPLDDQNVNRFVRMLGRFTPRTQFLVITHNKLTMGSGSAIFGVTQEEAGISKLVSVRLKEQEQKQESAVVS